MTGVREARRNNAWGNGRNDRRTRRGRVRPAERGWEAVENLRIQIRYGEGIGCRTDVSERKRLVRTRAPHQPVHEKIK